ncbi:hypothetical protein O5171_13795 [Escherichia coli]|nr:hypothetical protein [Escherichia coli]
MVPRFRRHGKSIRPLIPDFLYPGMRDFVYFPDLCLLQPPWVTSPSLYDWTEHYLTERSVIETGQGMLSDGEKADFGRAYQMYEDVQGIKCRLVSDTCGLDPGISGHNDEYLNLLSPSVRIFVISRRPVNDSAAGALAILFAFSSPQNVLLQDSSDGFFEQAGVSEKQQQLSGCCSQKSTVCGQSVRNLV